MAMCYLAIGFGLGPGAANLLDIDLVSDATVLWRITEVAMLVSLFAIGLRLRVPPTDRIWILPVRLGLVAMVLTVVALTLFCVYALGLSWGPALLLAAMLTPTDPVLAHDVSGRNARRYRSAALLADRRRRPEQWYCNAVRPARHRRSRYEATPSIVLHWAFAAQAAWGVAGALASGWRLGELSVRLIAYLRTRHGEALEPEGFYALGLIALSYGVAELLHTYAFLAVFAAGLATRRVEQKASGGKSACEAVGTIDADDVHATAADPERVHGFTIELERVAEVAIMLMVGAVLATIWCELFTWKALILIAGLFIVARPLAVEVSLLGSSATAGQRRLMSWFCIRGVGSFYYLLCARACAACGRRVAGAARHRDHYGFGHRAQHHRDTADEALSKSKCGRMRPLPHNARTDNPHYVCKIQPCTASHCMPHKACKMLRWIDLGTRQA